MAEPGLKTPPELLDVQQVANYLGLHKVTVVSFARQGKLPGFKVGREWRFRADDLRDWLEQREPRQEAFAQRFERLWQRLCREAEAAGYTEEDIPRIVRELREPGGGGRTASDD